MGNRESCGWNLGRGRKLEEGLWRIEDRMPVIGQLCRVPERGWLKQGWNMERERG